MARYKLKRKTYTVWDETDNLKRMKDADILAEKKKKTTDYGTVARNATIAGVAGAGLGIGAGAVKGLIKPGVNSAGRQLSRLSAMGSSAAKLGKIGATVGAIGAAASAYKKASEKAAENNFYNQRLDYAKRQALRRERKDWRTNMTQRDGYSY
jgi:hypothetical protein